MQDMREVFLEDIGVAPENVFVSIDRDPIAAASLAQVHKAILADGSAVAVKIQYPGLQRQIFSDLRAIRFFMTVIEYFYPDFGYTWFLPEFETSLHHEVNFVQEAQNSERVAAMFAGNNRVYVPKVLKHLSGKRVITMEFIDGAKVRCDQQCLILVLVPQDRINSQFVTAT
jgi:aarF domain-containing kinase